MRSWSDMCCLPRNGRSWLNVGRGILAVVLTSAGGAATTVALKLLLATSDCAGSECEWSVELGAQMFNWSAAPDLDATRQRRTNTLAGQRIFWRHSDISADLPTLVVCCCDLIFHDDEQPTRTGKRDAHNSPTKRGLVSLSQVSRPLSELRLVAS